MTEQEMLARIQELEEENAKLKHTKKKVSLLELFEKTYPWLGFSCTTDELSRLIRAVCFHKVNKPRKLRHDNKTAICDYILLTKDMTDEEKNRYAEIAGKLLAVLDEYEAITDTEDYQELMRTRKKWDEWRERHYGINSKT